MSLMSKINSPDDVRQLPVEQLPDLCQELRERIIEVANQNGGHLASSLGVVELTVALHYVFESPKDAIIWDVGNQSYAHKLLTGRRDQFTTIRKKGGLSGFTRRDESEHDPFGTGHASTSISAALGIAEGRRLKGQSSKVVAVIGDGGMTGGMAFEALNHAGSIKRNLVVVLNDNGMFIAPQVGAMSTWFSQKLTGQKFNQVRRRIKELLSGLPNYGEKSVQLIHKVMESTKIFFTSGILFEGLNFQYVGPVDGHDLNALLPILQNVRTLDGPVLVHVRTVKGKGLACAENDPSHFHGVSPCYLENGNSTQKDKNSPDTYTEVFSRALVERGRKNNRVVAITAAMPEGTGLQAFAECFPERFYDVGIAEEHAVTFAAGLACEGFRPVVAIYSTFLQRSYDQILHDVCLQNLPVTFVLDRAGLVGEDGPTHHGAFDLSYLGTIPNLTILAPSDENELVRALRTALELPGPAALRYPRGAGTGARLDAKPAPLPFGRGRLVQDVAQPVVALICAGTTLAAALQAAKHLDQRKIPALVADARFIKPLDAELIVQLAQRAGRILTIEENALCGGFGAAVCTLLQEHGMLVPVKMLGLPDTFISQGTPQQLRHELRLDADGIFAAAMELVESQVSQSTHDPSA
jgi:1-deoxy-D-xylulose-5-phosphate synthase